jgi:hypothetical protein
MAFKRKSSRIEVGKPGRLCRGSMSAPCQVLDVSEHGMRIQSRLFVRNGDALKLSLELDGGLVLNCEIQVTNLRPPHFGAKIISISSQDRERLARILDDHLQNSFLRR